MSDHYLVLEWAEVPGEGDWNADLDWHITHPPECEWDEIERTFTCAFQWEIDNAGVNGFGNNDQERVSTYPTHPSATPIEHFHDKTFVNNGSHYGWEHFTQIVPKQT